MYIGQASKNSGATIKAIRLYEELGLLSNISRRHSYRIYSEEDVLLIKFIKLAQTFDFKLLELKDIIHQQGSLTDWKNIRQAIERKEEKLTLEISRLKKQQADLKSYNYEIERCLCENSDCTFPGVKV